MPELPEVETVKNKIWHHIHHKKILSIEIKRKELRFPLPKNLVDNFSKSYIESIKRHGKYIIFENNHSHCLIIHLGMTGRFIFSHDKDFSYFYHDQKLKECHEHVVFTFEDGQSMRYYDPRRFGYMDTACQQTLYENRFLKKLGIDGLNISEHIDPIYMKCQKSKTPIKNMLLDQSLIAGVGNIYASEALWRSQINPEQKSCTLSKKQIKHLADHIIHVLQDAISAGGSTLKDYKDPEGNKGQFQNRFDVYDRKDKPCNRNDGGFIKKMSMSGRATYFCPICQKNN